MNSCKEFANTKDEQWSHITDEDRDVLRDEVQKVENWMNDNMSAQSKLSLSSAPILTQESINKQQSSLFKISSPIMSKKKPKPVVVPVPTPAPVPESKDNSESVPESKDEGKESESKNDDKKSEGKDSKEAESSSTPMEN
jgi:heat shock protein 4